MIVSWIVPIVCLFLGLTVSCGTSFGFAIVNDKDYGDVADPSSQRQLRDEQNAYPNATLAEGSLCAVSLNYHYEALSTRYNSLREVPPFAGIMFSVYSKDSAVEILTMELDLILENGLPDRSVEVYTKAGSYEDHVHDPGAWRMVANASVVVAPGEGNNRGAIIPAEDFKTVAMRPWEKRSFYVTMKDRLLDHTVNAMNNKGEPHVQGKDLKLLVGSGLTEYRFPDSGLDRTVDPQFAGVLHYRTIIAAGCEGDNNETVGVGSTSFTDVEYRFLPERQVSLRTIPRVNTMLDHATDDLLARSIILQHYRDTDMLRQVKNKTKTTLVRHQGGCPSDWTSCSPSVIQTTVTMGHSNALSSGEVLYQMYRHAGELTSALNEDGIVVDGDGEEAADVRYVGQNSALAEVQLTLTGTPAGIVMDDIQKQFLADSLLRFFEESLSDTPSISVFVVTIEGQAPVNNRERRRTSMLRRTALATSRDGQKEDRTSGSIRVHGKISGSRATHLLDKSFVDALKAAVVRDRGDRFLRWLAYDSLKPGPIAEDSGFHFFRDVTKVSAHFSVAGASATANPLDPEEQPTKERGLNYGIIFGAVFGFLTMLGALAVCKYLQEREKYKRELEIYREERKLERRKGREEKEHRKENYKRQQESREKRRRRPRLNPGKAMQLISGEASEDTLLDMSETLNDEPASAERIQSPLPHDGEMRQPVTDCADRDRTANSGSSDGRGRSTSIRELRPRDGKERRKDQARFSDGPRRSTSLRELMPRIEDQQQFKGPIHSSDGRPSSTSLRELRPRDEEVRQGGLPVVGSSDGRRRSTYLRELRGSTEEERRKGPAGSSDRRQRSNSLRELRPRDEEERRKCAAGLSEGRRRSNSLRELRPRNKERKKDQAGSSDEMRPRPREEAERRKGLGGSSDGHRRSTSLRELRPRDEEERRKGLAGSSDGRSTSLRELRPRDEEDRRKGLPLVSSSDELRRSTSLRELRPRDKEDQRKGPEIPSPSLGLADSYGQRRSTSLRELRLRDEEERGKGPAGSSEGRRRSNSLRELRPRDEEERRTDKAGLADGLGHSTSQRRKGQDGSSDGRQRSISLREVRDEEEQRKNPAGSSGGSSTSLRELCPRDEQDRPFGCSDELRRSTSQRELRPRDKDDQRNGLAGSGGGRQRSTSQRELWPRDEDERQKGVLGPSDGRQRSTTLRELRPRNKEERRKGLAGSSGGRRRATSLREGRRRGGEESSHSECHSGKSNNKREGNRPVEI